MKGDIDYMKFIIVTQRVEEVPLYNEKRDSLDENWISFLLECGLIPIILPNNLAMAKLIIDSIDVKGILLTGGNTHVKYGGSAPQRDMIDEFLIQYAIDNTIPLIGICRGMQSLLIHFSEELLRVKNHVAVNHAVYSVNPQSFYKDVNSYHTLSIKYNQIIKKNDWNITYMDGDEYVEGISHKAYNLHGFMWHPERNNPFDQDDIHRFIKIFNKE